MTINEKLKIVRSKLILKEKHFAELLGVPINKISKIESGTLSLTDEELKKLSELLDITFENLKDETADLPLLKISLKINDKKYKNKLSLYSEILKEYFPVPCKIFVLAKTRQKGKLENFLDWFFNNSKKSIIENMENFTPSYLIENENSKVLVSIGEENIEIIELNIDIKESRFVFGDYRYVKANEIILK